MLLVNNYKRRKHCPSETDVIPKSDVENVVPINVNEGKIMSAVVKADSEPNLIGDCSKSHSLPNFISKHADLKAIDSKTLASLMNGEYSNAISKFTVIDCRYPYEFEGGHIQNAINLYTQDQIMEHFFPKQLDSSSSTATMDVSISQTHHNVIVFHCEFSSERGPKMLRHLRSQDRKMNQANYPYLEYPEIYILHGGYKAFYETYKNLCDPSAYVKMKDDKNGCRQFRVKSKAPSHETRYGQSQRLALKTRSSNLF